MQNSNLYFTIFRKIYKHLTILLNIQPKKKAGRPLKVSDLQLAALYITSYSNTLNSYTCQISNLSFYSILASV